jgi:hypothetical protein
LTLAPPPFFFIEKCQSAFKNSNPYVKAQMSNFRVVSTTLSAKLDPAIKIILNETGKAL